VEASPEERYLYSYQLNGLPGEPSIGRPMALPENLSMTLTSAIMTLQMSQCQVDL